MALLSRTQMEMGHKDIAAHPDFDKDWCRSLLAQPGVQWATSPHKGVTEETVTNSMFEWTLYGERSIRAHLTFQRPCHEPDTIKSVEECFLISIGDACDGKSGRAHGGLTSILLDHISGHAAHDVDHRSLSPATATMTVDYKRPINTPCVILLRAWPVEHSGRKVWVKAVIEDEESRVYASAKSLFILSKQEKL